MARRNPKITTGHTDKVDFASTAKAMQPLALACTAATLAPWLMANVANLANACTTVQARATVRPGASHT